jgi:hypothetical protein
MGKYIAIGIVILAITCVFLMIRSKIKEAKGKGCSGCSGCGYADNPDACSECSNCDKKRDDINE